MPIRKVSGRGGNVIGTFPSLKSGIVRYESTIERDLLFTLEYDPTVLRYEMQPMQIEGIDAQSKSRTYIPDVLVIYVDGRAIIECKPAALVNDPHTQQQIALGQAWADQNDHDFTLVTDDDLRTGPRLANIKLAWRYARIQVPQPIIIHCRQLLTQQPQGLTFVDLVMQLAVLESPIILHSYIYHLIFHQIIHVDIFTDYLNDGSILNWLKI